MKQKVNLLEDSIAGGLAKLALPIMGTSLIQMAYNLTDMIWIGRISSAAVAAVEQPVCICGCPMDSPFWQEWVDRCLWTSHGSRE